MKSKFYIDMDGVLAIWNENASEEETHERGYFLSREVELKAVALVRKLVDSENLVYILSSVYEDDHSINEKTEWLINVGLGDVPRIFVPYGDDKFKYVDKSYFPVLIDDFNKNLKTWDKAGYLAIKFMNGINNRPKLQVVNDMVKVSIDSWEGYSIDKRMSVDQMFTLVSSISHTLSKTA